MKKENEYPVFYNFKLTNYIENHRKVLHKIK